MPKYKIVLQRFPYGSIEHTPCVTWLMDFVSNVERDPRFELILPKPLDDTPITMTRNRSVEIAQKLGADLLLMVDSDMEPDCEFGLDPFAKRFWPTTIEFMLNHPGPCVVGAPYCGPPPLENIYVFNWQNMESHVPEGELGGLKLGQFSREHAAILGGIQEVGALPTGLILFDMRCFEKIEPPYFDYEWAFEGPRCEGCGSPKPGKRSEKVSTEDVVTTRDLSMAGVKQYCNWDAWAGHRKWKTVRKPRPYTADGVAKKMHDAIVSRVTTGSRLIDVKPPAGSEKEIAAAMAAFERKKAEEQKPPQIAAQPELSVDEIVRRVCTHIEGSGLTPAEFLKAYSSDIAVGNVKPVTINDLFS